MVTQYWTLKNALLTIDKKVVRSIIDTLRVLELVPKVENVEYTETIKKAKQPGSATDDARPKVNKDNVLYLEVQKEYPNGIRDMMSTFRIKSPVPYIYDADTGLDVRALYEDMQYTVNISYSTESRTYLEELRQMHYNVLTTGSAVMDHMVEFTISIPSQIWQLTRDIHELREGIDPYGQSYEEYMQTTLSKSAVSINSSTGKHHDIEFKELQVGIQGWFSDPQLPEIVDEGDGVYSIEMQYNFVINRPVSIVTTYPIMVNNATIPHQWVELLKVEKTTPELLSIDPMMQVGMDQNKRGFDPGYKFPIVIPEVDSGISRYANQGYIPIVQSMVSVADDKRTLLNLTELGDIALSQALLNFIMANDKEPLTEAYKHIVHIRLFVNDKIRRGDRLTVDESLNIISKEELNLRDTHHVVIYLANQYPLIDERHMEKFIADEEVLATVINTLYSIEKLPKALAIGLLGNNAGNYDIDEVPDNKTIQPRGRYIGSPDDTPLHPVPYNVTGDNHPTLGNYPVGDNYIQGVRTLKDLRLLYRLYLKSPNLRREKPTVFPPYGRSVFELTQKSINKLEQGPRTVQRSHTRIPK